MRCVVFVLVMVAAGLFSGCQTAEGLPGTEVVAEGNPVFTHLYTADPSARVFGDRLYVYPSHDRDEARWWNMQDWHVFSTTDLQHWIDHGPVLSLDDLPWATKYAWAPDCIEKNGKYYFYFPTDSSKIGVAVSDTPYGPFTDPLGQPLLTKQTPGVKANRDFIDPAVFVDDDGAAYLFVGQNFVNVIKLNDDMVSFDGTVTVIDGADHFFEAPWVHQYNGKYYLSYSGKGQILYAMADNVLGPYEYKGMILDKVNSGTNHHSIVEYKGRWYLFYHTADLSRSRHPEGDPQHKYVQWRRSVCVDYLYYNEDGTIQPVKMTQEGVEPLAK